MLEAEHAFTKHGLHFPDHAIAVTGQGSKLHNLFDRERLVGLSSNVGIGSAGETRKLQL